jgi:hypothetical protein
MKSKQEDPFDPDLYIDHTFWILPLFQIIRDTKSFESFLGKRKIRRTPTILSGYKLLLRVIFEKYLSYLKDESFLGLTEDKTTSRAFFTGLSLDKIPATCKKANCVKNLGEMMSRLYHAKDVPSLQASLDTIGTKFVAPLTKVFEKNVLLNAKLSHRFRKTELLRYIASYYLLVIANDIERVVPLSASPIQIRTMKDSRIRRQRERMDHMFDGYKLGLGFLWQELLNDKVEIEVNRISSTQNWEELDDVFQIMSEVIHSLERDLGIRFGFTKVFTRHETPDTSSFDEITKESVQSRLSLNDKIDQTLLWYQFELIDSARSKIFSGSSTFTSLVIGEMSARLKAGLEEKLEVVRFKHAGHPVWFSYALLIERHGFLSDFSGWLIFLEVGGNYAGLGGTEYSLAEQTLRQNAKFVNVSDLEVDLRSLRNYFLFKIRERLSHPGAGLSETEIMRFRINDLERRKSLSSGRLLEFLVKSYYEKIGYPEVNIRFDDQRVLAGRKEIDVLAVNDSTKKVVVAECSTSIPIQRIDELVKELNQKLELVKASPRFKSFSHHVKVFVTTRQSVLGITHKYRTDILRKLSKAEIRLMTIEDDIIPKLPKRFNRYDLLDIFGEHPLSPPKWLRSEL